MVELAAGHAKPVRDLSQAFALGQLAKQHRNALIPTSESFSPALNPSLPDSAKEGFFIDKPEDLGEKAGRLSQGCVSKVELDFSSTSYSTKRRSLDPSIKTCLGQAL